MNFLKKNGIVVPARIEHQMEGWYTFTVRGPDGEFRRQVGPFKNLITNGGLNNVAAANWCQNCYVGTGNTAPANTDTALDTQVAGDPGAKYGNDSASAVEDTGEYYKRFIRTFRFDVGEAEGVLAEVGVGPSDSNLTSRALIEDGGGSPTTVTVLSDEILDVTYEVRMYLPTTNVTGTVVLDSITYDYEVQTSDALGTPGTVRPPLAWAFDTVNSGSGWWDDLPADVEGTASGGNYFATGNVSAAYVADSYKRECVTTFDYSDGNMPLPKGLRVMQMLWTWGYFLVQFDSQASTGNGIPKENTQELVLETEAAWARKT